MMTSARPLIARCFTGQFDRHEPAGFHERVDGTVHRRDPQPRHTGATGLEDFEGPERSGRFFEDLSNRVALSGLPFHTPI